MYRLNGKQRRRRTGAALREAWAKSGHTAEDPGLREKFDDLPRSSIRLIVCPLDKDVNQGGLLRLAEALRIEQVDFATEADTAVDMSGSRGAKARQPWRWIAEETAIAEAKAEGYFIVAITLSDRAIPFERQAWRFPLALVVGSELDGVPEEVEAMCDASVAIPLYGLVQSLNVVVATGIVLHSAHAEFVRQNPEFEPARSASRQLLGLPRVDYAASENL